MQMSPGCLLTQLSHWGACSLALPRGGGPTGQQFGGLPWGGLDPRHPLSPAQGSSPTPHPCIPLTGGASRGWSALRGTRRGSPKAFRYRVSGVSSQPGSHGGAGGATGFPDIEWGSRTNQKAPHAPGVPALTQQQPPELPTHRLACTLPGQTRSQPTGGWQAGDTPSPAPVCPPTQSRGREDPKCGQQKRPRHSNALFTVQMRELRLEGEPAARGPQPGSCLAPTPTPWGRSWSRLGPQ